MPSGLNNNAKMRKSQFEALADMIRFNLMKDNNKNIIGIGLNFIGELMNYLETQNPQFDRARFLKGCGVE